MSLTVLLLVAAALGGGGLLWYLFERWPAAGLVFWLVTVCFMPVWWAIRIGLDWRPAIIGGIILLSTYITRFPRVFTAADLGVGLLFMAGAFPLVFGGSSASSVFGLASQWILGFLLGRLVLLRLGEDLVYRIIVVMFAIVAVFAIVEFVLDWHPWSLIGPHNELYAIWGPIQGRGGLSRSEGAFGHSIALGCSLALTLPFVLAARLRPWVRFALACLMIGATLVTLSRGALLSAGLSILLVAVFGGRHYGAEPRRTATLVLVVGALVSLPALSSVLAAAGDEAGKSADYRGRLLDLIGAMDPLGLSGQGRTAANGERYIGTFQSIDSQIILTGLTYGWIVLLLGLGLVLAAAVLVIAGRASPGVIAIVGQIPAMASVALITQYNIFFWFIAGLGVAALAKANEEDTEALAQGDRELLPSGTAVPFPGVIPGL
jgi:hypothetical protein